MGKIFDKLFSLFESESMKNLNNSIGMAKKIREAFPDKNHEEAAAAIYANNAAIAVLKALETYLSSPDFLEEISLKMADTKEKSNSSQAGYLESIKNEYFESISNLSDEKDTVTLEELNQLLETAHRRTQIADPGTIRVVNQGGRFTTKSSVLPSIFPELNTTSNRSESNALQAARDFSLLINIKD